MKENDNLVEHFKPDARSNYCKKSKETIIEKLDLEERGAFEIKCLKTHEEFSDDVAKFFFAIDRKGDYVKTKGYSCSEHWHNMIGKAKKSVKLRKIDSHHNLPLLKSHELQIIIKKTSSYEKYSISSMFY